jgi:hypothetical protein
MKDCRERILQTPRLTDDIRTDSVGFTLELPSPALASLVLPSPWQGEGKGEGREVVGRDKAAGRSRRDRPCRKRYAYSGLPFDPMPCGGGFAL